MSKLKRLTLHFPHVWIDGHLLVYELLSFNHGMAVVLVDTIPDRIDAVVIIGAGPRRSAFPENARFPGQFEQARTKSSRGVLLELGPGFDDHNHGINVQSCSDTSQVVSLIFFQTLCGSALEFD